MYLHSISAYVDQIVDTITPESAEVLRKTDFENLIMLHGTWGMAIRNDFGLWKTDHPLTKSWHLNEAGRVMKDVSTSGAPIMIDFSEDHPDAISMKIMEGVWKKVTA